MIGTSERSGTLTPFRASLGDTLRVAGLVLAPIMVQGAVQRRLPILTLLARLDMERWGNLLLERLRRRHHGASVLVRLLRRRMVFLLSADDVRRVLEESPQPFALDNREKHGALVQFQPNGLLLSTGRVREHRRAYNEEVLDSAHPMHRLADAFSALTVQEAQALLGDVHRAGGRLDWKLFDEGFWRIVRRVVLGDTARDDRETTDLLRRLRSSANWSYLARPRPRLREEMNRRIRGYLERAEPGSLAALMAGTHAGEDVDAPGQVPHWLFAFDGANIATFRTLALLATHPDQARRADEDRSAPLDYVRACLLDCLRLWPTTPLVLRESSAPTRWGQATLPPGTAFVACSSFLQRDARLLPYADRFAPEIWLDGRAAANWSLIPFSGGPGACPGRNLALLVSSVLTAELRRGHRFTLLSRPTLAPDRPLPKALSHGAIRLAVAPR